MENTQIALDNLLRTEAITQQEYDTLKRSFEYEIYLKEAPKTQPLVQHNTDNNILNENTVQVVSKPIINPPLKTAKGLKIWVGLGVFLLLIIFSVIIFLNKKEASISSEDNTQSLNRGSTQSKEEIIILAKNGVMLRKTPATSGDEIVLMPSGAKVEVIEKTNQQDTFEGNTNYWYRVRYGNAEGYCFGGFTDADKKAVTNNSSTSSTQTMLQNYYQAVENGTMRAENYFSPSVIQFITVKNTTPQGVNQVFASNTEFVNQQSTITSDLMPVRQENGINYYIFETSFKCFRRSLNKYQLCNTKVEVGIDQNTKICSYKETGVDNLRYVDANGNSQNTPNNANNESSNNDKYNGEVPSGYAQAVTESGCTIRSQPTVRSEQTDFVPRWEMMQVLSKTSVYQKIEDKSGYWYKISYNGKVGYCFGGFMKVNF